jgi:membrane protease YdiL (CAAX protease family)
VLPFVLLVAQQDQFLRTYPFYKYANQSVRHFLAWQFLYAVQFLALEFFFRGYMLKGLRHKFGYGAIFVMIVPYCMIHYPKPLPETLGAILAGIALGTLAMRTRSIWGGVLIHVGVALTMDWLAVAECPPPGKGPCR